MPEDGAQKARSFLDRAPAGSEARSWAYVAIWSGIIFVSIPFAPEIVRAIARMFGKEAISTIVLAFSVLAFAAILALLVRRRRTDRTGYIWLAATGFVLLLLLTVFRSPYPAETLHYVEYGVLGFLVFRALSHRVRDHSIYLLATIVGTTIGTLDEFIQWLTPGRYFEMADIALNFGGVALAQIIMATAVRPDFVSGWPEPRQIQRLASLGVFLLAILGLCAVLLPG